MNNVVVGQRRIYFTEMLWRALMHWRRGLALVLASIIAVILVEYMADKRTYNEDLAKIREIDNAPLTKDELAAVEEAAAAYDVYSEYQKRSDFVMKFNPDAVPHATITFYPDLEYAQLEDRQNNITSDLMIIEDMYSAYVVDNDFAVDFAEALGNDILRDCFDDIIAYDFSNIHINHDMFVDIYYPDSDYLDKICTEVVNLMSAKIIDAAGTVGKPIIGVSDKNSEIGNNNMIGPSGITIAEEQAAVAQKLDELKETVDTKMSELNKRQVVRFNEQTGADYSYVESEKNATVYIDEKTGKKIQPVAPKLGFSFKLLILGVIIGLAAAILWSSLGYVYSSRLQDSEDMAYVFGLNNVGSIYIERKNKKKKIFQRLDADIYRRKTRYRRVLPVKNQIRMICQSIQAVCRNEGISSMCITSSNQSRDIVRISELIMYELLKGNLEVISCLNAMYDVHELKNMADCGGVLIIEQVDISRYSEITDEMRFVQLNGQKNIGYVNIV